MIQTNDQMKQKLAVFVSGSGTNLQAILDACDSGELFATVSLVVADNDQCYALERAKKHGVETYLHSRKALRAMTAEEKAAAETQLVAALKAHGVSLIVLAGYLSILDQRLVDAFPKQIINLHPSLIPAYCGKGYYGDRVHSEVLANKETESGITIHYVDGGIDTGEILLQKRVPVLADDTVETLAGRIHALEHENLKQVIQELLKGDKL